MSTDYSAVAMYGKYFRSRNDLKDFIEEIYPDAEVDYDAIYEVPALDGMVIECLNAYSGEHFILGYNVAIGETLDEYRMKWDIAFPGVEAKTHLEVRVS